MPSRAYTSFLHNNIECFRTNNLSRGYNSILAKEMCQCPLGLIPHFYVVYLMNLDREIERVNALSGLYLISTEIKVVDSDMFDVCQCPLWLIPHFYVPLQKPRFYAVSRACFCRYLSEYSDNSRFLCMLTFWTYLMRCTYP